MQASRQTQACHLILARNKPSIACNGMAKAPKQTR